MQILIHGQKKLPPTEHAKSLLSNMKKIIKQFYPHVMFTKQIASTLVVYQWLIMATKSIYQLKGLKPKNKGRTNFYECCDLTKKYN